MSEAQKLGFSYRIFVPRRPNPVSPGPEGHGRSAASRETSSSRRPGCMRPGRFTRNAWLNFMREYRNTHCGLNPIQSVIEGAKTWRTMPDSEKLKYYKQAVKTRPRNRPRNRVYVVSQGLRRKR